MNNRSSRIGFKYLLLIMLLSISTISRAQIEVSSGIDMCYPLLLNNNNNHINYGQLGFGLHFGVSYKPAQTQFFPTLDFSFGRTRLPLKDVGENVVDLNTNYLSLLLKGNFVITAGQNDNALYIIGGIGFSRLNGKDLYVSGKNNGQVRARIDSTENITKIFPAISLGFEYVYGASVNRNIYLSLGLDFQYIYLLPNMNSYNMTVESPLQQQQVNVNLEGRPIIPNFHITLHYLLGKEVIFWHKQDSRYL